MSKGKYFSKEHNKNRIAPYLKGLAFVLLVLGAGTMDSCKNRKGIITQPNLSERIKSYVGSQREKIRKYDPNNPLVDLYTPSTAIYEIKDTLDNGTVVGSLYLSDSIGTDRAVINMLCVPAIGNPYIPIDKIK